MAGSNTETLAGLAKELYPVDEIADMEQRVTKLKQEVEVGKGLTFSASDGGSFTFPVKAYGPHGQKMLNELEGLPQARSSNVVQGKSFVKEYAGVLQFSKRELELAKGDAASFANAKTFEMENLIENAHKYFNRQIANGDGSGLMTLVQGAQVAQTVIEVDDATPFQIGMVFDIFDSTGVTKQADAVTIVDIDILSSPNTIEVATAEAVTCDDNGEIYLAGVNDNAASDGKEMIGLPTVIDDGTLYASFQNIVRSGAGEVPNYRGISLDAVNAPISVALINQIMTRALRIGGVDFVQSNDVYHCTSPEQWRGYASLSVPQIRFLPSDSADMNKSFTQYECMGKRVVVDTDVSRTKWYTMRKSAIKFAVATPLDWESDLGGTSLKWLSGYNQAVMVLYALQQLYSQAPRDVVAITDLLTVAV